MDLPFIGRVKFFYDSGLATRANVITDVVNVDDGTRQCATRSCLNIID